MEGLVHIPLVKVISRLTRPSSESNVEKEARPARVMFPVRAHFNPSFSIVVTGGGGGGLVSLFPDINKSIITGEFHVFGYCS